MSVKQCCNSGDKKIKSGCVPRTSHSSSSFLVFIPQNVKQQGARGTCLQKSLCRNDASGQPASLSSDCLQHICGRLWFPVCWNQKGLKTALNITRHWQLKHSELAMPKLTNPTFHMQFVHPSSRLQSTSDPFARLFLLAFCYY